MGVELIYLISPAMLGNTNVIIKDDNQRPTLASEIS